VFDYMAGGALLDHLRARQSFTEREAALVMHDVFTAVAFLHARGIAHRDLKPENILTPSPERAYPAVLCDFDLSSSGAGPINSQTTPVLRSPAGTASFMGPELWAVIDNPEESRYSKTCDLWSLGVILYVLLSGKAPFRRYFKISSRFFSFSYT
jgi:serine/threonine protein kinase